MTYKRDSMRNERITSLNRHLMIDALNPALPLLPGPGGLSVL